MLLNSIVIYHHQNVEFKITIFKSVGTNLLGTKLSKKSHVENLFLPCDSQHSKIHVYWRKFYYVNYDNIPIASHPFINLHAFRHIFKSALIISIRILAYTCIRFHSFQCHGEVTEIMADTNPKSIHVSIFNIFIF